jgi:hypothetical protein
MDLETDTHSSSSHSEQAYVDASEEHRVRSYIAAHTRRLRRMDRGLPFYPALKPYEPSCPSSSAPCLPLSSAPLPPAWPSQRGETIIAATIMEVGLAFPNQRGEAD